MISVILYSLELIALNFLEISRENYDTIGIGMLARAGSEKKSVLKDRDRAIAGPHTTVYSRIRLPEKREKQPFCM